MISTVLPTGGGRKDATVPIWGEFNRQFHKHSFRGLRGPLPTRRYTVHAPWMVRAAGKGPWSVDLDKELATGQGAALAEAGAGLVGGGGGDPGGALGFGEGAPAPGDGGEDAAHGPLETGAGVGGHHQRALALAITATEGHIEAFLAGLGDVEDFHNGLLRNERTNIYRSRGAWPGNIAGHDRRPALAIVLDLYHKGV
jgi:hypothetical protein